VELDSLLFRFEIFVISDEHIPSSFSFRAELRCQDIKRKFVFKKRKLTPSRPVLNERLIPVQAWLEQCCCVTSDPGFFPSRAISVGSSNADQSLVELVDDTSIANNDYAALSYCWGDAVAFILTKDNINALKQKISLESLPNTIRDAVIVARSLQINYIWVDALCILQDSVSDWARESAQMAAIYENAKVVIRADLAQSCTSGFPHHFHQPEQQNAGALKFKIKTNQGEEMNVYSRRCLNFCEAGYYTISGDPGRLSTRGWDFQEQHMAQRSLVFGTHEIAWACPCTRDCECGTPIPRPHTDHVTSMEWTTIVRNFTARHLTKASDRLPAISGVVAKMMTDSETQISYNAGLWSNEFISHLSWYGAFEKEKLAAAAYHTPSWSWASATGPIRLQIDSDSDTDTSIHRETDIGFEVKEVVCKAATENPYGPVQKGAHLIVQGHLYVPMHVGEGNKQEIVLVHFNTIRDQPFKMPNIERSHSCRAEFSWKSSRPKCAILGI
jgi:Heterokaryon incompatibility protein (HET)